MSSSNLLLSSVMIFYFDQRGPGWLVWPKEEVAGEGQLCSLAGPCDLARRDALSLQTSSSFFQDSKSGC